MTPLDEAERESRLRHILEAATRLTDLVRDRTVGDYVKEYAFQWAVDRGLLIIGEAAVRIRRADRDAATHITNLTGIIGFRNRLVHDYAGTDPDEVWRIVTDDLPRLLAEVRALLPPE